MRLEEYHYVWLTKHPERTEAWLIERIADGFDIHHADGDHYNNDPDNLILIEHADHMALHGVGLKRLVGSLKEIEQVRRLQVGKSAYEAKAPEITWRQIEADLNMPASLNPGTLALNAARFYASAEGLPWPKPAGSKPGRQKIATITA